MPDKITTNIGLRQGIVLNRTLLIVMMGVVSRNVILKYTQEAIIYCTITAINQEGVYKNHWTSGKLSSSITVVGLEW